MREPCIWFLKLDRDATYRNASHIKKPCRVGNVLWMATNAKSNRYAIIWCLFYPLHSLAYCLINRDKLWFLIKGTDWWKKLILIDEYIPRGYVFRFSKFVILTQKSFLSKFIFSSVCPFNIIYIEILKTYIFFVSLSLKVGYNFGKNKNHMLYICLI